MGEKPPFAIMIYVSISLCEEGGDTRHLGSLPFASIEEAQADVGESRLETAADLLRGGCDPARFRYEVRGATGDLLFELPLIVR